MSRLSISLFQPTGKQITIVCDFNVILGAKRSILMPHAIWSITRLLNWPTRRRRKKGN